MKTDLGQPFDQQTANGDAQALALSGTRIGVINGCGALYVKRDLGQPFEQQTSRGDARALALSGTRIGVINGCEALYVERGVPVAVNAGANHCSGCESAAAPLSRSSFVLLRPVQFRPSRRQRHRRHADAGHRFP